MDSIQFGSNISMHFIECIRMYLCYVYYERSRNAASSATNKGAIIPWNCNGASDTTLKQLRKGTLQSLMHFDKGHFTFGTHLAAACKAYSAALKLIRVTYAQCSKGIAYKRYYRFELHRLPLSISLSHIQTKRTPLLLSLSHQRCCLNQHCALSGMTCDARQISTYDSPHSNSELPLFCNHWRVKRSSFR